MNRFYSKIQVVPNVGPIMSWVYDAADSITTAKKTAVSNLLDSLATIDTASLAALDGAGTLATLVNTALARQASISTTVVPTAAPVLTSITAVSAFSVGLNVIIRGDNLQNVTGVTFNSNKTCLSFAKIDRYTLVALIPASTTTGTYSVTNPIGTTVGTSITIV
jgi:hypothetical protein